jgi:hypothetical protein
MRVERVAEKRAPHARGYLEKEPMYYVYENWRAEQKAVIHEGACGNCMEGKGCHPNPLGNMNGKWHGPFKTLQEAQVAARATKRTVKNHRCTRS